MKRWAAVVAKLHFARGLLLVCCACAALAHAQPSAVVPPRPLPGPYPVACSDVAQDFARLLPGEDVQDYWEGVARADGTPRYITSLLSEPASTLAVSVAVPGNAELYGGFAGRTLPYAIIVCHPTSSGNTRPDYLLANGKSVPRMQRVGEGPWWPDATTRFPVLLFSHGYLGSPISNDYVDAVALLASYGYVVVSPFHGDGRFGSLKLEDWTDITNLILHLRDFLGMQAVRALSLSATLDLLLAHPQWRDRLDSGAIGGFGASLGGESVLLMAGAGLTTSLGLAWTTVTKDARLKAAVGYVPYFGVPLFPAFGRDQRALDDVTLPYLAISGTADTTAPIVMTAQGIGELAGPRELVALTGVPHRFDVASAPDIFTWAMTFLDAWVRGDATAQAQLVAMAKVAGGGDDNVAIALDMPAAVNYGGLWWAAPPGSEAGWGMNLTHEDDVVFATWFTYNASGKPWWLVMTADRMPDGTFLGKLYETRGPPFFASPWDPAAVSATPVGTGTLSFVDRDHATFSYSIGSVAQSKAITREVFGRVPWCAFATPFDPGKATNYQDLWWNAPPGSESGWGLNLVHEGDILFATWFTYDAAGAPLWLAATLTPEAPTRYSGTWYRASGPPFSAVPFDPAAVSFAPAGTARLAFGSGNAAQFDSTVDGIPQTKTLAREILRAPGMLCY